MLIYIYLMCSHIHLEFLLWGLDIYMMGFSQYLCFANWFHLEFYFLCNNVHLRHKVCHYLYHSSSLPSGVRGAGQMHASFTSDGKHIVSVSEDSNVCIWNYSGQDRSTSKAKKIWSSESFQSHNAAIAVPWCGIESMPGTLLSPSLKDDLHIMSALSSPDCLFLSRGFLSELAPKGSATWPEETLLDPSQTVVSPTMCKSKYKFLRSACKGMSNSHMWGQVFVTAGWDGHIRVYQNYGLPVRVWNQGLGSFIVAF